MISSLWRRMCVACLPVAFLLRGHRVTSVGVIPLPMTGAKRHTAARGCRGAFYN